MMSLERLKLEYVYVYCMYTVAKLYMQAGYVKSENTAKGVVAVTTHFKLWGPQWYIWNY